MPEETCTPGAVGEHVLALCAENAVPLRTVKLINLGSGIVPQGSVDELMRDYGLDAHGIAGAVLSAVQTEKSGVI